LALLGFVAGIVFVVVGAAPQPNAIDIKPVKYRELCSAVRDLKGKVVVVDVWAEYCVPCKKSFPHLVQMHQKYAKDGLVCISVSVDSLEKQAAALKFLQDQQATFPNYLLAEEFTLWQDKWDISGPPALFVFNRQNQRAAKFDHNDPDKSYTSEEVEKLVRELLNDKP
jgi:thiol-disulfide isomerase/thioredoxin